MNKGTNRSRGRRSKGGGNSAPLTVRGWVERKRKISRFYFLIALCAVLGAALYVEWNQHQNEGVWGTELFLLNEVVVNGAERYSVEEITEAAGLKAGETTMDAVDQDAVRSALTNAFSDFESVQVDSDVPSGAVRIDVKERTPTAWFRLRNGASLTIYCVDDNQALLERPFRLDLLRDVPLLRLAQEGLVELAADRLEMDSEGRPLLSDALRLALDVAVMDQVIHEKRHEEGFDDSSFEAKRVDARDPNRIEVSYAPNGGRRLNALLTADDYPSRLRSIREVERHRAARRRDSLAASAGMLDGTVIVEEMDARFPEAVYTIPLTGNRDE